MLSATTDLAAVILAAGMGTRMKSKKQKILHEVGGLPMITHVYESATAVTDHLPVLVIGQGGEQIQALFGNHARYVTQPEKLGTGHATRMAAELLRGRTRQVIVLYGDMPLLRPETIAQLAQRRAQSDAAVSLLSAIGQLPSSFGRVVRTAEGAVQEIVEVSEAQQRPNTADLLAIRELNVGVYCFEADFLWANLPHLPAHTAHNGQTEYYLTDMVGLAVAQTRRVEALVLDDPDEALGAGTRRELVAVERAFRHRANQRWLEAGVTLIDPATTYIDQTVTIGRDTIIWPNSYLQGNTTIGEDCVIGPNATLRHARVGDGCRLEQLVIEHRTIESGATVPPFTHLK